MFDQVWLNINVFIKPPFSCFQVYLAQTVFKLLMVTVIFSYTIPLLSSLSFTHTCRPEEEALVGYTTFECIHVLSSLLRKLLLAYLTLLGLYGLLNLYTLSWILHRLVPNCTDQYSNIESRGCL